MKLQVNQVNLHISKHLKMITFSLTNCGLSYGNLHLKMLFSKLKYLEVWTHVWSKWTYLNETLYLEIFRRLVQEYITLRV